jgi:hypothetical protein
VVIGCSSTRIEVVVVVDVIYSEKNISTHNIVQKNENMTLGDGAERQKVL